MSTATTAPTSAGAPTQVKPTATGPSRRLLWAILGFAALVRVVVAGFTNLVSANGAVFFLPPARALMAGDLDAGISPVVPPLYYVLVAAVGSLVRDVDLAAQMVSILAGTAAVAVAWSLARAIVGDDEPRAPVLAALFAAVAPFLVRYSAETQEDMLYGLCLGLAALAGWRLLRAPSAARAAAAGALVALGYLTRPEAMGLGGLIGLALLLGRGGPDPADAKGDGESAAGKSDGKSDTPAGAKEGETGGPDAAPPAPYPGFPRRVALGLVVAASFLVVASPNILIARWKLGVWTLSGKAGAILAYGHAGTDDDPFNRIGTGGETSFEEAYGRGASSGTASEAASGEGYMGFDLVSVVGRDPLGFAARWVSYVGELFESLPAASGALLLPLVVGLLIVGWRGADERRRTAARMAVVTLVFYAAALSFFYTSRRYWAHFLPMLAPIAAIGALAIADWVGLRWLRLGRQRALVILTALLVAGAFVHSLRPIAKYGWLWRRGPEREAGEFIGRPEIRESFERDGKRLGVLGVRGPVAYYADATHVMVPNPPRRTEHAPAVGGIAGAGASRRFSERYYLSVIDYARSRNVGFFVVSEKDWWGKARPFAPWLRDEHFQELPWSTHDWSELERDRQIRVYGLRPKGRRGR